MGVPPGELDLVAVGEILVDLISVEPAGSLRQASQYRRCFGGAPANVALNVAQLGGTSAVVGKVGCDAFGAFLLDTLRAHGVMAEGVVRDPAHGTSLVFVARTAGTPDFQAYRGADAKLRPEELREDLIVRARVVHTSAFALAEEPSRSAVLRAIELAKEGGGLVSLEPNYRPSIWPHRDEAQEVLGEVLRSVDLVKPSLDDARALFGERSPEGYVEEFARRGPRLVVLTLGRKGCLVYDGRKATRVPAFEVAALDATGAGDAFWAGFLLSWLGGETPLEAARFGNAVAALKVGGIAPLPRREEVYRRLRALGAQGVERGR